MNRSRLLGLALVLAALAASVPSAHAQAPFPGAVQPDPINHPTQWVPCSHPLAIDAGRGCVATSPAPAPAPPPLDVAPGQPAPALRVGRAYRRTLDGARIYVLAIATNAQGIPVTLAQCLDIGRRPDCPLSGDAWVLPYPVRLDGWTVEPWADR
jgi:hypothetical protein